jgi:hypothetical protein
MTDPIAAREQAIAAAIASHRIPAARAQHYRDRWDRDPKGTAQLLERLAPGVPSTVAPNAAEAAVVDRTLLRQLAA